jgi:hypothetical protein
MRGRSGGKIETLSVALSKERRLNTKAQIKES